MKHRPQKISGENLLFEVGVERRGIAEERSNSSASDKGRNGKEKERLFGKRLLEEIISPENLTTACKRVKSNKGCSGIDEMEVSELPVYLKYKGEELIRQIIAGEYKPKPVKRVEIPKADGSKRELGIPTVIDRLIQQSTAQLLSVYFETVFSEYSYGFRANKSAHDAVQKAKEYIESGYEYVVDIDLAKYFDTVNHDKLMALLSKQISDKRVLKLIRSFLNSGVMINGVVFETYCGCPQGGPLSPLLSNVMLNELDKELTRRGHKFCRYADDSNIYVRSKRAGQRVMQSIRNYLEKKLKLKVNEAKSAVDRPWKRKFLGFSFYKTAKGILIRAHEKSILKLKDKIKQITSRSNAMSELQRISTLNSLFRGWVSYFGIAEMKSILEEIDQWARRRLRMCIWKSWKKVKTRFANLVKLGISKSKAWMYANTRKGYWRISNSFILSNSLTNSYFAGIGLNSLSKYYQLYRTAVCRTACTVV